MSDLAECFLLGTAVGAIAAALIGALVFHCEYGRIHENWRTQAIQHGAAEYRIVNPKTGEVKFMWKDETK